MKGQKIKTVGASAPTPPQGDTAPLTPFCALRGLTVDCRQAMRSKKGSRGACLPLWGFGGNAPKVLLFIFLFFLAGCGSIAQENERISVVATIFPQYDWLRNLIGVEHAYRFELHLLIDNRVDLHSFNPSVSDIARVRGADALVYVGGHSDGWVRDVVRGAPDGLVTMALLPSLGAGWLIMDEVVYCEDCGEVHDFYDFADEHVWMSLRRVMILCRVLAGMLVGLAPDLEEAIMDNLATYLAKLEALEAAYLDMAANAARNAILVADRFPFRYLVLDYGWASYAAFHGCSAETEASFATIINLAERVNALALHTVLITESADGAIARTVIENSHFPNAQVRVLDSIQSVTSQDVADGITFLGIKENNLIVLREALQ